MALRDFQHRIGLNAARQRLRRATGPYGPPMARAGFRPPRVLRTESGGDVTFWWGTCTVTLDESDALVLAVLAIEAVTAGLLLLVATVTDLLVKLAQIGTEPRPSAIADSADPPGYIVARFSTQA